MTAIFEDETTAAPPGIPRLVPEGWHLRSDVGALVGRSRSTIKSWERDGLIAPDGQMPVGATIVKLYSTGYVRRVVKPFAASIHRGRRPVGTMP